MTVSTENDPKKSLLNRTLGMEWSLSYPGIKVITPYLTSFSPEATQATLGSPGQYKSQNHQRPFVFLYGVKRSKIHVKKGKHLAKQPTKKKNRVFYSSLFVYYTPLYSVEKPFFWRVKNWQSSQQKKEKKFVYFTPLYSCIILLFTP